MMNHQSNEISIRSRKLQQQAELLESYFDASAMLCQSRITDRKGKIATNFLPVCERMETQPNNKIQFLSFENLSDTDI